MWETHSDWIPLGISATQNRPFVEKNNVKQALLENLETYLW